ISFFGGSKDRGAPAPKSFRTNFANRMNFLRVPIPQFRDRFSSVARFGDQAFSARYPNLSARQWLTILFLFRPATTLRSPPTARARIPPGSGAVAHVGTCSNGSRRLVATIWLRQSRRVGSPCVAQPWGWAGSVNTSRFHPIIVGRGAASLR